MKEKYVKSFDNVRIHYSILRKSDEFVVLIHGLGGNLSAWKKVIPLLIKNNFSVIAIDLRGHGKSSNSDKYSDYAFDKFAKDIKKVIDNEKVKKINLIGHCFGGIVSINFAYLYKKYLNSLILVSSTYKKTRMEDKVLLFIEKRRGFINKFIYNLLKYDKLAKKKTYVDYSKMKEWLKKRDINFFRVYFDIRGTSLKCYYFCLRRISSFNFTNIIMKIKVPTLIIHGRKDKIFYPKAAIEMHKKIKKSKLYFLNTGHFPIFNSPKKLSRIITYFIEDLERSRFQK